MGNEEILIDFKYDYNEEYCKKIYFSKNTIVKDALIQYLKIINSIIDLSPHKILFLYKEEVLNQEEYLNKRFSDFKYINNKIIVRVIEFIDVKGAGRDLIEFCDVSNGIIELINSNIIYKTTGKGINIYGFCQEKNCIAYNQMIVVHINKKYFDLLNEKHDLKCPICNNIIIPNTVGFLQCKYKIKGRKYEGMEEFNINGIADKPDKVIYYNSKENKNGKTKMFQLCFEII